MWAVKGLIVGFLNWWGLTVYFSPYYIWLTDEDSLMCCILRHDKHTDWRNKLRFLVRIEEWIYDIWSGLKEWIAILVQIEGMNCDFWSRLRNELRLLVRVEEWIGMQCMFAVTQCILAMKWQIAQMFDTFSLEGSLFLNAPGSLNNNNFRGLSSSYSFVQRQCLWLDPERFWFRNQEPGPCAFFLDIIPRPAL